jgi:hypothetical protein
MAFVAGLLGILSCSVDNGDEPVPQAPLFVQVSADDGAAPIVPASLLTGTFDGPSDPATVATTETVDADRNPAFGVSDQVVSVTTSTQEKGYFIKFPPGALAAGGTYSFYLKVLSGNLDHFRLELKNENFDPLATASVGGLGIGIVYKFTFTVPSNAVGTNGARELALVFDPNQAGTFLIDGLEGPTLTLTADDGAQPTSISVTDVVAFFMAPDPPGVATFTSVSPARSGPSDLQVTFSPSANPKGIWAPALLPSGNYTFFFRRDAGTMKSFYLEIKDAQGNLLQRHFVGALETGVSKRLDSSIPVGVTGAEAVIVVGPSQSGTVTVDGLWDSAPAPSFASIAPDDGAAPQVPASLSLGTWSMATTETVDADRNPAFGVSDQVVLVAASGGGKSFWVKFPSGSLVAGGTYTFYAKGLTGNLDHFNLVLKTQGGNPIVVTPITGLTNGVSYKITFVVPLTATGANEAGELILDFPDAAQDGTMTLDGLEGPTLTLVPDDGGTPTPVSATVAGTFNIAPDSPSVATMTTVPPGRTGPNDRQMSFVASANVKGVWVDVALPPGDYQLYFRRDAGTMKSFRLELKHKVSGQLVKKFFVGGLETGVFKKLTLPVMALYPDQAVIVVPPASSGTITADGFLDTAPASIWATLLSLGVAKALAASFAPAAFFFALNLLFYGGLLFAVGTTLYEIGKRFFMQSTVPDPDNVVSVFSPRIVFQRSSRRSEVRDGARFEVDTQVGPEKGGISFADEEGTVWTEYPLAWEGDERTREEFAKLLGRTFRDLAPLFSKREVPADYETPTLLVATKLARSMPKPGAFVIYDKAKQLLRFIGLQPEAKAEAKKVLARYSKLLNEKGLRKVKEGALVQFPVAHNDWDMSGPGLFLVLRPSAPDESLARPETPKPDEASPRSEARTTEEEPFGAYLERFKSKIPPLPSVDEVNEAAIELNVHTLGRPSENVLAYSSSIVGGRATQYKDYRLKDVFNALERGLAQTRISNSQSAEAQYRLTEAWERVPAALERKVIEFTVVGAGQNGEPKILTLLRKEGAKEGLNQALAALEQEAVRQAGELAKVLGITEEMLREQQTVEGIEILISDKVEEFQEEMAQLAQELTSNPSYFNFGSKASPPGLPGFREQPLSYSDLLLEIEKGFKKFIEESQRVARVSIDTRVDSHQHQIRLVDLIGRTTEESLRGFEAGIREARTSAEKKVKPGFGSSELHKELIRELVTAGNKALEPIKTALNEIEKAAKQKGPGERRSEMRGRAVFRALEQFVLLQARLSRMTAESTQVSGVSDQVKQVRTPALVFVHYRDLVEKFSEAQRSEVQILATQVPETEVVIYSANVTDQRVASFTGLDNVLVTPVSAEAAFKMSGAARFSNRIAHLSKSDSVRLRREFKPETRRKIRFFRHVNGVGGLGIAAILQLDAGGTLPGIRPDEEGFFTFVNALLQAKYQEYLNRFVVFARSA